MRLGPAPSGASDAVSGRLDDLVYVGAETRLLLTLGDGPEMAVRHDPAADAIPAIGDSVTAHWPQSVARIVA